MLSYIRSSDLKLPLNLLTYLLRVG